ncbi:MAG: RNA polymerase sigma factor [Phycisphaerae bacterium]|jgi:RNA polymerase sigma-70 factor (ECF subfamily)
MLEDALLRARFNRGHRDVLPRIYEKYKHELVTLAAALLYDKSKAQDAVHDVFIALLDTKRQLKIRHTLKGYLATAVANAARSSNRAYVRAVQNESSGQFSDELTRPDTQAASDEMKGHLLKALAELPYEQREVIMLRIFSGLKFRTIAKSQNVLLNTVQGRYRYGLEKLRAILNETTNEHK